MAIRGIEVEGLGQLVTYLRVTGVSFSASVSKSVRRGALIIAAEIQKQIRGSRTRARLKGRRPGLFRKVTRGGSTKFRRFAGIPDHVLGILSGHLRRSIGSRGGQGIFREGRLVGAVRLGTIYFVDIGTRVKYGPIHEFGGTINHTNLFGRGIRARIRIPKRPYFEPGIRKGRPKALREIRNATRVIR